MTFDQYITALIALGHEFGCTCQYTGQHDLVELDGDERGAIIPHDADCPLVAELVAS